MAKRNKLIMASVFEDTKTLQIYLLWTCQGRIEPMRTRQQRHGKTRQVHGYGLSAFRFGSVIPL